MITIGEALHEGVMRLSYASSSFFASPSPRLDAEVLLAHVLGSNRASLLAHSEDSLSGEQQEQYDALLERRSHGEPVAYLRGHKEFYGLDLYITPDVLVPRPETESAVEACLEILPVGEMSQMADIGTGSGAIAVAVTVHRPLLRTFATDISAEAIEVARRNCKRHAVADRVTLYVGHLLEPLPRKMNVIAANLPYVPPEEAEPDVALWEPKVAVFGGGEDGMALIKEFLATVPRYLLPGGVVIMETAHSQGTLVARLASRAFPEADIEVRKDLSGYDRIVVIKTA